MATLRVDASLDNLDRLIAFCEEEAAAAGMSPGMIGRLALAVEEAFVNICSYAYPQGGGFAELRSTATADGLEIEMADAGAPFDLLSLPDPDTSLSIDQRQAGGLGVHFIRHFSDRADYRREGGQNLLRMLFRYQPEKG